MKQLYDMTEPELRDLLRRLARKIEDELPSGSSHNGKCCFVLLVDDGAGVCQYVSNAWRGDCIKWMRETADRLERREDVPR